MTPENDADLPTDDVALAPRTEVDDDGGTTQPRLEDLPADVLEAVARRNGWRSAEDIEKMPRDRRPKGPLLSALQYMQKVETEVPLLRNRLRAYDSREVVSTEKISSLQRQVDSYGGVIRQMSERMAAAELRGYEKARRELEAQMDAAIEEGRPADAREARRKLTELEAEKPTPFESPQPEQPAAPAVDPAIDVWKQRNKWFTASPALNQAAIEHYNSYVQGNPGVSTADALAEVTRFITSNFARVYPQHFPGVQVDDAPPPPEANTRRRVPGSVAPPANGGAPRPKKMTYADLTAEQKEACDILKTEIPGFTDQDYIDGYLEQVEKGQTTR